MQTIRWGIIGCGDVTEVKSGPGFRKAQDSALVAVMRRDGAKAADYARRHGVPRWYDDADKLWNYMKDHPPEKDLDVMEKVMFMRSAITQANQNESSFSYQTSGRKQDVKLK